MRTSFRFLSSLIILLAVGCSKTETRTATTPDGDKVTMASKGDKVSMEVKTKSGEKVSLQSSASGMALPADFPKDIPIHPKGVVQTYNVIGTRDTQVGILIPLAVADVVSFYETELKKQAWTSDPTMKMGEGALINAKKDQRVSMLMIAPQDPKTTFVQMSLSSK